MKESKYKSYDDLPLFLNAKTASELLEISQSMCYELMRKKDFPSLRIGSRLVVQRENFTSGSTKTQEGNNMITEKYIKNAKLQRYFPLPNSIFNIGLETGEIAVYAYLLYCEDRKTFQCYPSYKTIGNAVGLSRNTVRKYVMSLEEKQLIKTELTKIKTKDGKVRNGNLLYTILPIDNAIEYYNFQQAKAFEQEELLKKKQQLLLQFATTKLSETTRKTS